MRFDIVIHQIEIIRVKIELDDIAVEVILIVFFVKSAVFVLFAFVGRVNGRINIDILTGIDLRIRGRFFSGSLSEAWI